MRVPTWSCVDARTTATCTYTYSGLTINRFCCFVRMLLQYVRYVTYAKTPIGSQKGNLTEKTNKPVGDWVRSLQWRHKARINYPWGPYGPYRHTIQGNIGGEETFYRKIMMSPLWHHGVTWHHREHDQSITHGHFLIGCPLEPSNYLDSFSRNLSPKLRQGLLRDEVINDVIRPGLTIREDHIDKPYRGILC